MPGDPRRAPPLAGLTAPALLGVIHLMPLPGSPRGRSAELAEIIRAARHDAEALLDAGFDGFVLENFGDVPFFPGAVPAHVLTMMTRVACELPLDKARFTVANVLRNDAAGALAIVSAAGLDAIRVNVHCGAMLSDQGIIEGRAAETLRLRAEIAPDVLILADVDVKHAAPIAQAYSIEDQARDTAYRGLADALIVTGSATGSAASFADFDRVRAAVLDRPLIVGSGVTRESANEWAARASAIIVGSALKKRGDIAAPIDREIAAAFVAACRGA